MTPDNFFLGRAVAVRSQRAMSPGRPPSRISPRRTVVALVQRVSVPFVLALSRETTAPARRNAEVRRLKGLVPSVQCLRAPLVRAPISAGCLTKAGC